MCETLGELAGCVELSKVHEFLRLIDADLLRTSALDLVEAVRRVANLALLAGHASEDVEVRVECFHFATFCQVEVARLQRKLLWNLPSRASKVAEK